MRDDLFPKPAVALLRNLSSPVIRFSQHPFVKRGHAKILGTRDSIRNAVGRIGLPALAAFSLANPFLTLGPEFGGVETIQKNLETITFSADSPVEVKIPNDAVISHYVCRLAGTLDVTGGTGAGTIHPEGPYSLLRRVQIVMDGRAELNLDGKFWRAITEQWAGRAPTTTNVASLAAGASNPFSGFFIIPHISPRTIQPWDTAFPANAFINSEFNFRVEWGNATDLAAGADGTLSFSVAPTLEVTVVFARRANPIFQAATRFRQFSESIGATGDLRVGLPKATSIRAILVRTSASSGDFTSGVAQDGIMGRLSLESSAGVLNLNRIRDDVLREERRLFSDLEDQNAGYHYLEQAANGKLSLAMDTRGVNDPALVAVIDSAPAGASLEWATVELFSPA